MALSSGAFRLATSALVLGTVVTSGVMSQQAQAQSPTASQALKLMPIQKDVDYDLPSEKDAAACTIKAEKVNGQTGWIVRDGSGTILREFLDTNKDNIVDRWTYYKNGIEVYRDIDENFNGKADNHRWLNTAGTRWGVDKSEDGQIDYWKSITPEETTAELVMALRDRDPQRFARLLVTANELKALGLGPAKTKDLGEKLSGATESFKKMMARQTAVGSKTEWTHFGGSRPGLVPAGTEGSTADIIAYENVVVMVDSDGKDGQVPIGALVKVGDVWRLIDAPQLELAAPGVRSTDSALGGTYFIPFVKPNPVAELASAGSTPKAQQLIEDAQEMDAKITAAAPEKQAELNDKRADLLMQIIGEVDAKDRDSWIRNFADTISAATQTGGYPKGPERLEKLFASLQKSDPNLAAYVRYRALQADYGLKLQEEGADYAKIQATWLENLEKFADDFPKADDAAEAMLQLGLAEENTGQEAKAKAWYGKIISNFPETDPAKKANGAIFRLDSVGKTMQLKGPAINGTQTVDLSQYKGKHVLIHYWATWCEPCKVDLAQLKELQTKYGKQGFELIGVGLDDERQPMVDYLSNNRLPWAQVYEPGGLNSRLANEMGVQTLPTMILVDDTGKVINRGIHITELDNELKRKLVK
ncbi:MAG: thioredoxin-like domain-containing protein [Planctomycetota bacterium]|nr:thioredoxin-like domain-containing protein [Planctomycetota bacterium]